MTTLAAPAPRVPITSRAPEARMLRHPDASNASVMARRGWWLVALGWLVPGSAQVLAGNRKLGRFGLGATLILWSGTVIAGLGFLLWREGTVRVLLNPITLLVLAVLAAGYGVLWVVLGIDTLRLVRLVKLPVLTRIGVLLLGLALIAVSGSAAAFAAPRLFAASQALGSIFGQSGAAVSPSDGYYNLLLLGADSGDGRDSIRFDSISVVSINAETGAAIITGIPRELSGVPFSDGSPMLDLYPSGFEGYEDETCGWDNWMNHIRQAAEECREDRGRALYPDADATGSAAGIEATKDAAEGLLGIEIPYYVFLDMDGFAGLIDALGGVEVTVSERLPKGGGPAWDGEPAEDWAIGWIEPGTQRMDGDTAQWYARSRYTTSDFDRMQRQRQLQQAILAQFTPENVLNRFQQISSAGRAIVATDIPQSMLPTFIDLAALTKSAGVTSLELTPESELAVNQDAPDVAGIQSALRDLTHPDESGQE